MASSRTAPRPNRWSMTRAGILPLRKPGTVTCWLIFLYAASRLGLSSSKGTSTVSRTRVGFRVSTALFTVGSPWGLYVDGRPLGDRAGRLVFDLRISAYRVADDPSYRYHNPAAG